METRGALLQFYLGHVWNKRCSARHFPIWRVQWSHWMSTESPSSLQTLVVILSTQALTYFSHTAQGCSHYPLSVRKKLGCRSSEWCSFSHAHLCVELGGVHRYLWLYALEFNGKTAQLLLGFDTSSASPMEKRACFTTATASITPHSFPFSNRKTNHITFSLQPTLGPLDGDFLVCKWQRPLKQFPDQLFFLFTHQAEVACPLWYFFVTKRLVFVPKLMATLPTQIHTLPLLCLFCVHILQSQSRIIPFF